MRNKNFAYALLGLNVICAWSSWWTLGNSIFGRVSEYDWLIPTVAFSLWAIIFTLTALFTKSRLYLGGSIVLGALAYPLLNSFNLSLFGVGLAVLILIATERGMKKELEKGVQINFYYVVRQSLKFFVTAACLVVAFSYFFSLDGEDASLGRIEKQSLANEVNWGLNVSTRLVAEENKETINDILSGITLDEYLLKNNSDFDVNIGEIQAIRQSAGNFGASAALQDVNQSLNQKIQEDFLNQSKGEISKRLGIDVKGQEPVKDIIVEYIDKSQNDFFEKSAGVRTHLPVIMALALFLTARILATVVDIFLGFIILALISLFRRAGVISMKKELREAAVIEYSI